MKKIRMSFGILWIVILTLVLMGVCAVVGLDISILAGKFQTNSIAIPIVSMVAAIVVGVIVILVFGNSYYGFKEKYFQIMLGFFADKIEYKDVVVLKQDIETKQLYAVVFDKNGAQVALKVNVPPSKTEAFITSMREHISDLTIEMFSQPKKDKNKDEK